jgi:hypothetical protein
MWFCFKYHQWRIQAQGLEVIFSHHQVCVKRRREDTFFAAQSESRISAFCWLTGLQWNNTRLLSPLSVRRLSFVRPLTFHILINSSEATGSIRTKLWWNGPWMAPFQNCVRWSRLPTKMATKLKIEKRGDEILIVHCCVSKSQNELKC